MIKKQVSHSKQEKPEQREQQLKELITELRSFATLAEKTLHDIENDLEKHQHLFSVFDKKMFAIRGTAAQLQLDTIAHITSLGEEIAIKAGQADKKAKVRRCVSCLWDVLTTVKYLLEHLNEETTEEQGILIHHLEDTLRYLGGERPKFSSKEIDEILKKKRKTS